LLSHPRLPSRGDQDPYLLDRKLRQKIRAQGGRHPACRDGGAADPCVDPLEPFESRDRPVGVLRVGAGAARLSSFRSPKLATAVRMDLDGAGVCPGAPDPRKNHTGRVARHVAQAYPGWQPSGRQRGRTCEQRDNAARHHRRLRPAPAASIGRTELKHVTDAVLGDDSDQPRTSLDLATLRERRNVLAAWNASAEMVPVGCPRDEVTMLLALQVKRFRTSCVR
jgi:hypothetical protein